MTPTERKALEDYVAAVRKHYGPRLVEILVFGSRARGDARPDSDMDVAVILEDGKWKFWNEKWLLAGLAYDVLLEHDLFVQPWPVARSAWEAPRGGQRKRLIEEIRKDGQRVAALA
jgi:predicted nucleotidyltransferase